MFQQLQMLPYFLYATGALSALRALQCYIPSTRVRMLHQFYTRVDKAQVSALAARQFGTLRLLSAIVQINAGLSIHHRGSYLVAMWSFLLTLLHFVWERIGERTVSGRSLTSIEIVAFVGFLWMILQMGSYVEAGEVM